MTIESKHNLGEDHTQRSETKNNIVVLYKKQGNYDQAEQLFVEAIEGRSKKLGNTHPHTIESIKSLIALYETQNKPEEAEKWRAKLAQFEDFGK